MKLKISNIIPSIAFISIAQLLFFWLVPTDNKNFWVIYPFFTVITLANTMISVWCGSKHKFPTSFAPICSGTVITVVEIVTSICMALLCDSTRASLFTQLIMTMTYVLTVTVFISIASKESINSIPVPVPVTPYPESNGVITPIEPNVPARRKPTSINP